MKFRADVEGLRALAIVPVVVFHAWPQWLPGGFIGVDVFFVISGFLITSLLLQRLEAGSYSIASFYAARIRRIFPALFAMLLVVLPVAAWLLAPQALEEFARVLGATSVFASNLELYRTTGYFEGATELKPLVHTWSLAVEEQYYIFFPLMLAALHARARRWLPWALAGLGLASLAYAQVLIVRDPPLAFYSAASRTCELMVGSLLAWRQAQRDVALPDGVRQALGLLGLLALGGCFVWVRSDWPFPGLTALLPCLGAAALIEAGRGAGSWASRWLSMQPLRWIGALSFSLYLWHWPALVFTRHWLLGHPAAWQAGIAVTAAVALAWASLRWVETPVRRSTWSQRRMLFFGAACIALGLLLAAGTLLGARWLAKQPTPANQLLASAQDHSPGRERCHTRERFSLKYEARCVFGDAQALRQTAVWGDSHGVEIAHVLGQHVGPGRSVAQMTAAACPPSVGFQLPGRGYCPGHNATMLKGLVDDARVDRVLIVSRSDSYVLDAETAQRFEQGLAQAVAALRAAGKQVWLLDPVPGYDYPVPAALAQLQRRGQPPARYGRSLAGYEADTASARAVLGRVASRYGATRIEIGTALCPAGQCAVVDHGRGLYLDNNHLSVAGAELLFGLALRPVLAL